MSDLALTQLSFSNLAKVTEYTDLALTWLPLLTVMENALDLAKVTEFKGFTNSHGKYRPNLDLVAFHGLALTNFCWLEKFS